MNAVCKKDGASASRIMQTFSLYMIIANRNHCAWLINTRRTTKLASRACG